MRKSPSAALATAVATGSIPLTAVPPRVDRLVGAAVITRQCFPVSPRSLETWPVPCRRVNGRAMYDLATLLRYAQAKLDAAPLILNNRT